MNINLSHVKRYLMIFSLLTTVSFLAGCDSLEGDRGPAGKAGADGAAGAAGPNAPTTTVDNIQTQIDALVTVSESLASAGATVEQCSVCHSNSAEIHEVTDRNVFTVDAASVDLDAVADTVTIHVTISENGLLYTKGFKDPDEGAYSSAGYLAHLDAGEWVNDLSTTYTSTSRSTGAFSTTNAALIDESDAANGNYSATFPAADLIAANIDATRTYRVVFYARAYRDTNGNGVSSSADGDFRSFINAVVDVAGTAGDSKDLVDPAACLQCHYDGDYIAHGGRQNERFCVVCHNPAYMAARTDGYRYELKNLIHGLHNSEHNGGYDLSGAHDGSDKLEFGFPQSMSNCATCHQGTTRIAAVTAEANYKPATCITCHGGADNAWSWDNFPFPSDQLKSFHVDAGYDETTNCSNSGCHATGGTAKLLSEIHDGYDKEKELGKTIAYYTPEVTVAGDTLTVVWGAYNTTTDAAYDVTNGDTTVGPAFMQYYPDRNGESDGVRILVGYYGWGTNDIVASQTFTSNATSLPTLTTYDAGTGKATTTITLTTTNLTDYSVTRGVVAIIGVPTIQVEPASGATPARIKLAAVRSVTKDFNFDGSAATARTDIVNVSKCDVCHDNLLIHAPDSHGHTAVAQVDACVVCHNPSSAAGHYPQQSRSLKSYIHAIHAQEPTFTSYGTPGVEGHAIEFPGRLKNCLACHDAGTYEVPAMNASLGGVVGGFEDPATYARDSADDVVTGPAAIACGGCHRALLLEESEGKVAAWNSHTKTFGFRELKSEFSLKDAMDYLMNLL